MKIEKVNDHQIRCTLTGADLANRQLKISELAYGSEKAKRLFRDMMQQASNEFGFEAEDIPLMIEAIPVNADCIVLIITKVEDPDEIDTRFSKFSPSISEEDAQETISMDSPTAAIADDVLELFQKIKESRMAQQITSKAESEPDQTALSISPRLVKSENLSDLCSFSRIVAPFHQERSTLYKDEKRQLYLLLFYQGSMPQEAFGRVCNIASEYGMIEKAEDSKIAYMDEHFDKILTENAIVSLSKI